MNSTSSNRILIIEDEPDVVDMLTLNLRKAGGFTRLHRGGWREQVYARRARSFRRSSFSISCCRRCRASKFARS